MVWVVVKFSRETSQEYIKCGGDMVSEAFTPISNIVVNSLDSKLTQIKAFSQGINCLLSRCVTSALNYSVLEDKWNQNCQSALKTLHI